MKPNLADLPDRPGVYLFRDNSGTVIYVGKARSLQNRVRSYFQSGAVPAKTKALRERIETIEFIVTSSEVEALVLEINLIKRYRPRFNVMFVDDKHYPYIRISPGQYPRVSVVRRIAQDGGRYFGPYTLSGAVGHTLKLARQLFGYRTCNDRKLASGDGPCLYYQIKRCPGPCIDAISPQEYAQTMDELALFLSGRHGRVIERLRKEMQRAADDLQFERAAVLRDRLKALDTIYARQTAVINRQLDQDVVAILTAQDDDNVRAGTASAQVLQIRDGKLVGQEHFLLDGIADESKAQIMDACLKQYYGQAASVLPEVLVSVLPTEMELLAAWLSERAGRAVKIRRPQRGVGRQLLAIALDNARLHAGKSLVPDLEDEQRQRALEEIRDLVGLDRLPRRIEGYDTSASAGALPTAAMVVFTDGRADRAAYRRFSLEVEHGADDLARLREAIRRRLRRLASGDKRFGERPDLMLTDGGSTQRAVVLEELARAELDIPVIALAKQQEMLFVPGRLRSVALALNSPGLQLLQSIRDEAHRFAISYHRVRRSKRTLSSVLDEVPGIGPTRKRALIARFGSVATLKSSSIDEIAAVSGISRTLAARILQYLS